MRARRRSVTRSEALAAGARAASLLEERLAASPASSPAGLALLYASLPGEMDTAATDAMLRRRGWRVAYPRVAGDAPLELALATPESLVPAGKFLIAEPVAAAERIAAADVDLVLVPALAFDRRGCRLGFGKGHYDRLLATMPRAVRYGACLSHQLVSLLPSEPHDEPLDFLVVAGEHAGEILPTSARALPHAAPGLSASKETL